MSLKGLLLLLTAGRVVWSLRGLGGTMHNAEWIPLGAKLPLIVKQQAITGAPLAWYWGVCWCVWRGLSIWFGSRRAHRYKANIVMTDVWWRGSGLWKIHLSSQLKLRGGREERDMGAGRLGGYPLCVSHSGTCGEGGGSNRWVSVCLQGRERVECSPAEAEVVLAAPFHLNAPTLPLPSPISFALRIPHPSLFYHIARNPFPGAEATLMWED